MFSRVGIELSAAVRCDPPPPITRARTPAATTTCFPDRNVATTTGARAMVGTTINKPFILRGRILVSPSFEVLHRGPARRHRVVAGSVPHLLPQFGCYFDIRSSPSCKIHLNCATEARHATPRDASLCDCHLNSCLWWGEGEAELGCWLAKRPVLCPLKVKSEEGPPPCPNVLILRQLKRFAPLSGGRTRSWPPNN